MPTENRSEQLGRYHFECKCKSCISNFPPFTTIGNVNLNVPICRLLSAYIEMPGKNVSEFFLKANKNILLNFEKSAVKFLEDNEHLDPTNETLKIQFMLMLIWNYLGR